MKSKINRQAVNRLLLKLKDDLTLAGFRVLIPSASVRRGEVSWLYYERGGRVGCVFHDYFGAFNYGVPVCYEGEPTAVRRTIEHDAPTVENCATTLSGSWWGPATDQGRNGFISLEAFAGHRRNSWCKYEYYEPDPSRKMKTWVVTGTLHGSIIDARTEGEARRAFHEHYRGESITHIKRAAGPAFLY